MYGGGEQDDAKRTEKKEKHRTYSKKSITSAAFCAIGMLCSVQSFQFRLGSIEFVCDLFWLFSLSLFFMKYLEFAPYK